MCKELLVGHGAADSDYNLCKCVSTRKRVGVPGRGVGEGGGSTLEGGGGLEKYIGNGGWVRVSKRRGRYIRVWYKRGRGLVGILI